LAKELSMKVAIVVGVLIVLIVACWLGSRVTDDHDAVVSDKLAAMADALSAVELPVEDGVIGGSAARERSLASLTKIVATAAELESVTASAKFGEPDYYLHRAAELVTSAGQQYQKSILEIDSAPNEAVLDARGAVIDLNGAKLYLDKAIETRNQ
jgi:hypothetical protein